jgi:hypothetical protein
MKSNFTAFVFFVAISTLFTINNLLADKIKIIEHPKSITEYQGKTVTTSNIQQGIYVLYIETNFGIRTTKVVIF